jgi:3-deoxy-D-manno-octulosonate 8-phosphate phosphatase (KDO 8-P phosphatase)
MCRSLTASNLSRVSNVDNEPRRPSLSQLALQIRLLVFDFDGVFTTNAVYVFEDGRELVRCSRFDGIGLQRLARTGIATLVLSTEVNPVVGVRCHKLGITCVQACEDKVSEMGRLLEARGLAWCDVGFVGNDVNDLGCLKRVALPIVVADAHPDVCAAALYQTRRAGGMGAVREVCDLISDYRERASMGGGWPDDVPTNGWRPAHGMPPLKGSTG